VQDRMRVDRRIGRDSMTRKDGWSTELATSRKPRVIRSPFQSLRLQPSMGSNVTVTLFLSPLAVQSYISYSFILYQPLSPIIRE
jgi:hypothetical protein